MPLSSAAGLMLTLLLLASQASCNDSASDWRFLTTAYLLGSGELAAPIPMMEFAEPGDSASPDNQFTGTLRLVDPDQHGELQVIHDPFDLVGLYSDPIRHLPDFEFDFILRGGDLIPIRRGVIRTEHPFWEYILQPGRVWRESGDGSWSRASVPFALQERSANCTHNGVLTWLFDGDGNVSRVVYQISSETCAYFKFNMWGIVPAVFESSSVAGAAEAISRMDAHRAARIPAKPIAMLAEDYPGVNTEGFGVADGVKPEDMTVYGLFVDGVHYRGGCQTRHGPHPYCDSLPLPSYSTAKSIFAGVALMRMEKLYPGIAARSISSLVAECSAQQWADVSVENALDMATGSYEQAAPNADEDSAPHVAFIDDDSHASKIEFACNHFKRRADPGTEWVYHTSDTYLLGTALRNYLSRQFDSNVDPYEYIIAGPIWDRLHLSPLLDDTKRTYDEAAQPYFGYGLTYETDDILKIAIWLNSQNGEFGGEPYLDEEMLAGALQRNPDDRGLPAGSPSLRYNNGFWGFNATTVLDCSTDIWVPFMSGYGGITVAMFPNGTVYYYFSDGYVHRWRMAAVEIDKIRALCQ